MLAVNAFDPLGSSTILPATLPVKEDPDDPAQCDHEQWWTCPDGTSRDPVDCKCKPTKLPFDPKDWVLMIDKPSEE